MSCSGKILIGLNIAILLLLIFFVCGSSGKKSESFTTDDVAGSIPSLLIPDMNPYAGHDVKRAYLPARGWQYSTPSNPRWMKDTGSAECPYSANNPIKGGDMKHNPNEINTVNNNSQLLSNEKKNRDSMMGGNEAPQFWEPVEHLDDIGFYHNVNQSVASKSHTPYLSVQENFTTDELLRAIGGGKVL